MARSIMRTLRDVSDEVRHEALSTEPTGLSNDYTYGNIATLKEDIRNRLPEEDLESVLEYPDKTKKKTTAKKTTKTTKAAKPTKKSATKAAKSAEKTLTDKIKKVTKAKAATTVKKVAKTTAKAATTVKKAAKTTVKAAKK